MNPYGTADASSAARTQLLRRGSASAAVGLRARRRLTMAGEPGVPAIRFMLPMRIHFCRWSLSTNLSTSARAV